MSTPQELADQITGDALDLVVIEKLTPDRELLETQELYDRLVYRLKREGINCREIFGYSSPVVEAVSLKLASQGIALIATGDQRIQAYIFALL